MAILKLLRNKTIYESHEKALEIVGTKAATLGDGEAFLATYGEAPNAKTLLVIKRDGGVTIFDNETSSDALTKTIEALDAIEKDGLTETDTVENGKHVGVKVVETDGVITSVTVVESDIASATLLGTTADDKTKATAFGYIAKEAADRATAISNTVQSLAKEDAAVAKKFVTEVSETNGVIDVKRGTVSSNDKTVVLTDNADGGINLAVNIDGSTIVKNATTGILSVASAALIQYVGKDAIDVSAVGASDDEKSISLTIPAAEKVLSQNSDGLITTIALKSVTPSSTNIREEYELQGINGAKLGTDTIKVYKDSAYKEIYLGTANDTIDTINGTITKEEGDKQSLNYAYMKADGTYDLVKVDVSAFISENEAGNGVQIIEHKVAIKLADGNESFLTVDSNGLKLSGVATAIANAINALDVAATSKEDDKKYVKTTISETDGKVANDGVTVVYGDYNTNGQKSGIATTEDTKTYVDAQITAKNVAAEGDAYVNASAANNKVTVTTHTAELTTAKIGAADTTLSGTAQTLVDGADAASKVSTFVNTRISEEVAKLDATVTDKSQSHIGVTVVETDGVLTSLTVAERDIASATDLIREIAHRKAVDGIDGDAYAPNTTAIYINNATSLKDADDKLDTALNTVDSSMLTGVTGSDAITVSTKSNKNQTISLKLDTETKPEGFDASDNVLKINEGKGLYLSSVLDCGEY